MVLSKWALFFSSSSFALFVLDLVWTLVWFWKNWMFTRRGTVRRRDGTAGRRVNIKFFHENCTWVCFLCFVCTGPSMSPTAREQTNIENSRGLTAWFDSSRVNFQFFKYYIWYSTIIQYCTVLYSTVQYCTVLLQQYCCDSTVATVLLQQYCCNSTVATVLLQQYRCNSTVATVLSQRTISTAL